jgi:hypothetical protein
MPVNPYSLFLVAMIYAPTLKKVYDDITGPAVWN